MRHENENNVIMRNLFLFNINPDLIIYNINPFNLKILTSNLNPFGNNNNMEIIRVNNNDNDIGNRL